MRVEKEKRLTIIQKKKNNTEIVPHEQGQESRKQDENEELESPPLLLHTHTH